MEENIYREIDHFYVIRGLRTVDADDLVDPTDEGGYLDVDTRYGFPATAETPRHQTSQLEEIIHFAN